MAFEYQGEQHYRWNTVFGESYRDKDKHKREACKRFGITLIEIPYWWDGDIYSLAATIHKYCPWALRQEPKMVRILRAMVH